MMLDPVLKEEFCGSVREAIQQEMAAAGIRLRQDLGKMLEEHKCTDSPVIPGLSQRRKAVFCNDATSDGVDDFLAKLCVPLKLAVHSDEEVDAHRQGRGKASRVSSLSEASCEPMGSLAYKPGLMQPADTSQDLWSSTDSANVVPGDTHRSQALRHRGSTTSGGNSEASSSRSGRFFPLHLLRMYMEKVVTCAAFESAICLILALDAAALGIETEYDRPAIFRTVNLIFCVTYFIELCMRIIVHGRLYLGAGGGWKWNVFDTAVIATQIVHECLIAFAGTRTFARPISNVSLLRMLRFARLLRVMRALHVFHSFRQIRSMVDSITASLKTMGAAMIPIIYLVYAFGVYVTAFVTDLARERPELHENRELAGYFGSLPKSLMSLFQAVTGGIDWNDLLKPLMAVSPYLGLVLVLYIAFMVIAVLNVVTGFFVDSAMCAVARAKDVELGDQMRAIFEKSVRGGRASQMLSWDEFRGLLEDPHMANCLHVLGIDPSEAKGLFTLLDTDSSGEIDAEEFVLGALRLKGNAKAVDLATLMYFNKRMAMWWHGQMGTVTGMLRQMCDVMMLDSDDNASEKTSSDPRDVPTAQSMTSLASYATWTDLKSDSRGASR